MKYIGFTVLVIFLLVITTSCRDDRESFPGHGTDGYVLKLNIGDGLELSTRSVNVEDRLTDACFMVFDESGKLEESQFFDVCPTTVTFQRLSDGAKELYALANCKTEEFGLDYNRLKAVNYINELREIVLSGNPKLNPDSIHAIPMTHVTKVTLPLVKPDIRINFDRMLARIILVNDLTEKGFCPDSVTFTNLTQSFYPWAKEDKLQTGMEQNIKYKAAPQQNKLFILPTGEEQIGFTVFGRNNKGATQRYDGKVLAGIKGNHSYAMSLSTGTLTDIGAPSRMKIEIDPATGHYSEVDSVLYLNPDGGNFSLSASSYDSLRVETSASWLSQKVDTRAIQKEYGFSFAATDFITADTLREGLLTVYNSYDKNASVKIKIKQQGENRGPKYYVVVVSGQSNASGRDRSPLDVRYDNPDPRVFELGTQGITPPHIKKITSASSLNIVPLYYSAQSFDSNINSLKSMHLSLGKQILPHIPSDYNVLVISIAFSGSGFQMPESEGVYDPVQMRPANYPNGLQSRYKMIANKGILFNALVDRTLYALSLNKRNKFAGVVWSQGEVDANTQYANPEKAYKEFEEYSQAFFDAINHKADHNQLPKGMAGKHLWYPIDCVPMRKDWHRNVNIWQYATSQVFGAYKVWNPDTYIAIPTTAKMNEAIYNDDGHFGQNAFPETIIPLVIDKMIYNGVIGDGIKQSGKCFTRKTTLQEATAQCGSFTDQDIQNGLILSLPFSNDEEICANKVVDSNISIANKSMQLTDAQLLTDINGAARQRRVLKLNGENGGSILFSLPSSAPLNSWSASFMLRRENGKDDFADRYLLRVPNTNIGLYYHKYAIESEGGYLGLAFQPWKSNFDRFNSVVARLNDASYVRTHNEWIHYSVSYNHVTRTCRMYMNGELTMEKIFAVGAQAPNITSLLLGGSPDGLYGQLFDLHLWNREVPGQTLFKTYLMSYYGLNTQINIDTGMEDWGEDSI